MKKNLSKYPGYPLIKTYSTPKMWFLITDAVKRGYNPGFIIDDFPHSKYFTTKHKIAFIVRDK